jgi:hypothetical protein
MFRRIARMVLAAVLAVLALPARAPAAAPEEPPAATAKPTTAAAKAVALATKLSKRVTLDRPAKHDTLQAVLQRLAKRHHLNLWIDTLDFQPELLEAPEDLPPLTAIPLDCLHRRLLGPARADFIIRDGIIEVMTQARIEAEFYRGDPPPVIDSARAVRDSEQEEDPIPAWRAENFPLMQLDVENRPLRAVLRELAESARCNVLVSQDPKAETRVSAHCTNLPFDTAVILLADMAGLKVTWLDHVLYVGQPTVGKPLTWLVE